MIILPDRAVSPGPFRDLCVASLALYPEIIARIERESGISVEAVESGILVLAETPGRAAMMEAFAVRERKAGSDARWVDATALRGLEPGLSPHVIGAVYSAKEKHVNPALVTRAFCRAAEAAGAEIRQKTMLTGFRARNSHVYGVMTNAGEITEVDAVVLAAGPWSSALAARLGVALKTPPMRGQMIAYRSEALRHAVWGEAGYLVPKPGGVIFAGATIEDVGFRKTTTSRGVVGLKRMATDLCPELADAEMVSAWAGLRPGSPDGLPIIGRLPGRENVFVATGHFRNGILLAPITGKLVSQLVLDGKSDKLLKVFSPARFG